MEESAIAVAFKKLAADEMEKLLPLKALAEARSLPVLPVLKDFQETLSGIQSSSSDDCVRILTETGDLFRETRERVRKIRTKLDDRAIDLIREARRVVYELGPRLSGYLLFADLEQHLQALKDGLDSEDIIDRLEAVGQHTKAIADAYRTAYIELFDRRREAYEKAIGELRNRPEWETVSDEAAGTLLAPLRNRLGSDDDRKAVTDGQSLGAATLGELESDIAAVDGLKSAVLASVQEQAVKKSAGASVRRVRVADVFDRPIQSQDDLNT